MATLKQIEANRRNSLKSTGPKTPEGKAAVRLNPLRHGLYAKSVILPGESREKFEQVCDDLEKEWRPQTPTEQEYVEEMAACYWKKIRLQVAENSILTQDAYGKDQIRLADLVWKAQARLQRAFTRAQKELQQLQKERRRETAQPVAPTASEKSPAAPAPRAYANGHAPTWITSPPTASHPRRDPDRREGS